VPEFAHLSTILGADRERLSKRHGATSIASFREMGILPEALVNYLALLGWGPEGGLQEVFTHDELVKEFKLERVKASPAVFDFDKLNWLNRHYRRMNSEGDALFSDLAWPHFFHAGLLPDFSAATDDIRVWFSKLVELFVPSVSLPEELLPKTGFVFGFDVAAARVDPENAALLATESSQKVLFALQSRLEAYEGPVTAEQFKAWMNEIKTETGVKGKELFHPVRIALTGSHSGPEFDKLIPLIEEGSTLALPKHIPSVRERIVKFMS